ncbi:MAG: hypothetical protein MJY99_00125 [Fibrobacter sp.]|nr:hypothetical protein [Fibrobacter sp.]
MRKRYLSAVILLCSSFLFAQEFDSYQDEAPVAEETSTEASSEEVAEPAVEESAPAEEVAEPAAEESASEEVAEPAAEESASEEVAEPAAEESASEEVAEPAAEESAPEEVAEPAPEVASDAAPAEEEPKLAGAKMDKAPPPVPAEAKVYIPAEMTPADRVKSVQDNMDTLANNMESTLIGKDDAPLAVSGYMAFRVKNFDYTDIAPVYGDDKARTQVDATLKMNMVLMPNSYMTLWTNMTFPFDLTGLYTNYLADHPTRNPGFHWTRVPFDHNTDYTPASVDEEMNFGVDIRSSVFGAYVTAGGVIWANASPLTMWERETMPRFAWQYETFEEEKTVSTYYKEKSFKPVKEGGRAFWTNRSFGGVFMNVYNMPFGMIAQAMISQPKDMDAGTRDGLRLYGGQPSELEMGGNYDFRGDVYHARLAKTKLFDGMTLGANYIGVFYDDGLIDEDEFAGSWTKLKFPGDPHFENNQIVSMDIKGNINPKFYIMADVGVSWDDSTLFQNVGTDMKYAYDRDSSRSATSSPEFGVYVKAQDKHLDWLPTTVEAVYFTKNFFSPYGITDPSRLRSWRKDEFYLNAGSLRYGPNMAGINFKFEPEFNRGRLGVQYGQHRQIEEGKDVLLFNYRLNGRNMWESTNSWTKYNALFWADSGNATSANGYVNRAGVLTNQRKMERQRGGLYGGTWELWESFVAYENADQLKEEKVPEHVKWSSYLSIDGGYDIGHWFGTDRNVMMAGYASISGISKTFAPVAYSESQTDMLLWSFYGLFEPTFALTPTVHLVGHVGLETWKSEYGYTVNDANVRTTGVNASGAYGLLIPTSQSTYEKAPLDYYQTAFGIGVDWDFSARAGIHLRYKYATHTDNYISENDWTGHFITAETKVWF